MTTPDEGMAERVQQLAQHLYYAAKVHSHNQYEALGAATYCLCVLFAEFAQTVPQTPEDLDHLVTNIADGVSEAAAAAVKRWEELHA